MAAKAAAKRPRQRVTEPDGAFDVVREDPPTRQRAGKWAETLRKLEDSGEAHDFHRIRVFQVKDSAGSVASHLRRRFGERWEFKTREFEYNGNLCGGIWARLKNPVDSDQA